MPPAASGSRCRGGAREVRRRLAGRPRARPVPGGRTALSAAAPLDVVPGTACPHGRVGGTVGLVVAGDLGPGVLPLRFAGRRGVRALLKGVRLLCAGRRHHSAPFLPHGRVVVTLARRGGRRPAPRARSRRPEGQRDGRRGFGPPPPPPVFRPVQLRAMRHARSPQPPVGHPRGARRVDCAHRRRFISVMPFTAPPRAASAPPRRPRHTPIAGLRGAAHGPAAARGCAAVVVAAACVAGGGRWWTRALPAVAAGTESRGWLPRRVAAPVPACASISASLRRWRCW